VTVDDEYEEDYESMIRDISIQGLSALSALVGISQDSSGMTDEDIAEVLKITVDFAKNISIYLIII